MLTDEEKREIREKVSIDSGEWHFDLMLFATEIERAVMKKLGEQEPVLWQGKTDFKTHMRFKTLKPSDEEMIRGEFVPLYANPLPAQAVPEPIETAPEDGEFLALSNDGEWLKVHNQDDVFKTGKRIVCHGVSGRFWAATHWKPLSAAPKP